MKNVEKLYDEAASRYDNMYDSEQNKNIVQAENKFLQEMLPIDDYETVLDCGAGTGLFLDLFSVSTDGYVGFDISGNMIDEAKKKHPDFNLFKKNFLDYQDTNKYDLVTSLFSITDYCGNDGFYKLLSFVKPRGFLYATFMNKNGGYDATCHKEMNTDVKTMKYSYEEINDILKKVDYDWSYILGFSSTKYDNDLNSVEEIYKSMSKDRHKLNDCKYYLLMLQL